MHKELIDWFIEEKRDLPWRRDATPYAVWVSEVMLQQTQVAVVIPYFERWMQKFPSVEALAAAPLDTVIKAWEGLGYYSRARNLHAGACHVVKEHNGQLPSDPQNLAKIKGIGPYTVGAIRSFAFNQKAAAVDGNVMRVLMRYFHMQDDLADTKTSKKIWKLANDILPDDQPWVFSEALIELGATICTKKPSCFQCPLKNHCQSYRHGDVHNIPYKSIKQKTEKLFRAVAIIVSKDNRLLVKRIPSGKIMSDLHEFPFFEISNLGISEEDMIKEIQCRLDLRVVFKQELPMIKHTFTKYNVSLFPRVFSCLHDKNVPECKWMDSLELSLAAFSSGHRRLLLSFLKKD